VSSRPKDCRDLIQMVLDDENVDGVLVGTVFLDANMGLMWSLTEFAGRIRKPITSFMDSPVGIGQKEMAAVEASGIPTFPLPDRAATGLAALFRYGELRSR